MSFLGPNRAQSELMQQETRSPFLQKELATNLCLNLRHFRSVCSSESYLVSSRTCCGPREILCDCFSPWFDGIFPTHNTCSNCQAARSNHIVLRDIMTHMEGLPPHLFLLFSVSDRPLKLFSEIFNHCCCCDHLPYCPDLFPTVIFPSLT